jgi:glycosyltransferase involved in cell wall biosynthesis
MEAIRSADFSVFLRERSRVTTAGFPTKFVESMAVGTPVITTITSDLEQYLRDGENGLVCPAPIASALRAVIERALTLSPKALQEMRVQSRRTAENEFDFREFTDPIGALIREARRVVQGASAVTQRIADAPSH